MKVVAYVYSDPLLEPTPDPTEWGWELDRVYQDFAVGVVPVQENRKGIRKGSPDDRRHQWQQLLQDCETEPADYVLVRQLEDLGDSVQAVRDRLSELESVGIPLVTLDELVVEQPPPQPDVSRADVLQQLQEMQYHQRSRRIRQGHARNRVKALPPPGKAPYGYRRSKSGYVIDRSTVPVVKDFFEQFLLYGSVRGAVRYLAKRYGKKIAVSTGQRWLTNPVYRGDLEYQDGKSFEIPILPSWREMKLHR